MFIDTLKLINFDSKSWNSRDMINSLVDVDAKDKVSRTEQIMQFLVSKISSGDAKIDKEPHLYVLNVKNGTKSITSIIGGIKYDEKKILFPNENTHRDKLVGYSKIFDKYKLQINPILTFYKNGPSILSLTGNIMKKAPKIEANVKGVEYRLWTVDNLIDLQNIRGGISRIDRVYIADGHHRFSIFQNSQNKAQAKIMIALTDSTSICLKSCHRVIVGDIDTNWLQKVSKYCVVEPVSGADACNSKDIIICFKNGLKYRILFNPKMINDISVYFAVNNIIFNESFGIRNKEGAIFPLPGTVTIDDTPKIFDLYPNSSAIVFVPELDISEFFKVVDKGDKLPPTSTWFEPKIVDGFLMCRFG